MSKITCKSILRKFLENVANSFQGKKFLPSLLWGIVRAVLSTIISAFALDKSFSSNNVINQIYSALFFYLLMTTLTMGFKDIRRGEFGKRFISVCKDIYQGIFGKEVLLGRRIAYCLFFAIAFLLTQFMPPLFTVMLGISFLFSAVAKEQSQILFLVEPFKKKNKDGAITRGTYLSKLAAGILVGTLLSAILTFTGVYESPAKQTESADFVTNSSNLPETGDQADTDIDDSEDDISADTLYTEENPFVQKFTEADLLVSPYDDTYFRPSTKINVWNDYLYTSFDGNKTFSLWVYDITGFALEFKGKIIYDSEEALLSDNDEMELTEGTYNEEGYTYCDNVLYYLAGEEELEIISAKGYKYDFLADAASGAWDEYFYYFSRPYGYMQNEDTGTTEQTDVEDSDVDETNVEDSNTSETDDSYQADMTDVYDAAVELAAGMAKYSREQDREAFDKLFYNTSEADIDTYYNIQFSDVSTYENVCPLCVMESESLARVSVVFYTIPADYPSTGEDTYLIALLLGRNESGEWRIEVNSEAESATNEEYLKAAFTDGAYQAYLEGRSLVKRWLYFDTDYAFTFEGAFLPKLVEYYANNDGSMTAVIYLSNGTDNSVYVTDLASLIIISGDTEMINIGADLNVTLEPGQGTFYEINIPAEYITSNDWSNTQVAEFIVNYEMQ